jgi:hypothetical protein
LEIVLVELVSLAISLVVGIIILSPVLWLVGRWLVGKEKAKFTDAILIIVIGLVVNAILGWILTGWLSVIGWIVMLIVWLYLIKHFFDCGWLKALLIAIVTVIVFVIIGVVLALIGVAVFSLI